VEEVVLGGGARIAADLVVVGIGVVPNTELAAHSGLPVGNGIVADDHLRVAEGIFAIGDCAEYPNLYAQSRLRLESVQNAVDQGTSVARAICGRPAPYDAAPWFWTDQFDIHLQMVGISDGFDQTVTRGDPTGHKFSVFFYRERRLIAVNSINRAAEHLAARKLIAGKVTISPQQASDESFDLKMN
jgi:3-phenylpropionate/trans-cinnamate dioxygenase ferredoxin reductase subunit